MRRPRDGSVLTGDEQDPGSCRRCPAPLPRPGRSTHPLPGLVLAVLRRHLAKALPGLQLLHGLHGPAVLLAQDVPNLRGGQRGCGERGGGRDEPPGAERRTRTPPGPRRPPRSP